MCGAIYNVNDFPLLPGLLLELGYTRKQIDDITGNNRRAQDYKRDLRPTDSVFTLVPTRNGIQPMQATWWLALDKETLKPVYRWKSFNCKSTNIFSSKLHSIPPRSYRAVVLARGFFEWQPIYEGGYFYTGLSEELQAKPPKPLHKRRFLIHQPDQVMLMAALCKHWIDKDGNPRVSTGVITLPPHTDFLDIHHKSFPLLLTRDELDDWLNPDIKTREFSHLFELTDFRIDAETYAVNEENFEPVDTRIVLKAKAKLNSE